MPVTTTPLFKGVNMGNDDMTVRTAERRRSTRAPNTYRATLHDGRNRSVLGRGRTANISENGVLLVLRSSDRIPETGNVCISLMIPADPIAGTTRQVVYRCRIVRRQEMGNMLGLGLEFITKLS